MGIWDIIALITGVLGVLLTIFEKTWCWPMALISVVISGITFYNQNLYGDMGLQLFYFLSGVYGWIYWSRNKKKSNSFLVSNMPVKSLFLIIISIIIQSIIYYFILKYIKSDQVLFDSILTACSLTCTYMMTKKWLEIWALWVLIDFAYILLYIKKDLPAYAILYTFYTVMAGYGFYSWKKQLVKT